MKKKNQEYKNILKLLIFSYFFHSKFFSDFSLIEILQKSIKNVKIWSSTTHTSSTTFTFGSCIYTTKQLRDGN